MATSTQGFISISDKSQQGLLEYSRVCDDLAYASWDLRGRLAAIDKEYYRENLTTKDAVEGRAVNQMGKKNKLADIVVPIIEPQIETSLAYLTSVFCTGQPIFGCVATPEQIQQAKVMEAQLDEQARHGGWVGELIMAFRDGLKYNIFALECCWWEEKTYQPFTTVGNKGLKTEQTQTIWRGNRIKRLDMYNTAFDLRVAPSEIHKKGEFAGYVEVMSRVMLKEFLNSLPVRMNTKEALESRNPRQNRFYIPDINWDTLVNRSSLNQGMDWMRWATFNSSQDKINYANIYEVSTKYCRIIPSDFSMETPARNTPQIWKLIVVNDSVIVSAEKQTNSHNFLPILFGQVIEDGLAYQTKSPASRLIPIQDTASALWNFRIAAKRRSISDRGLYNPLLVREADINSDNPSAKIPVRPSAYGKDLREAYYPIPYEDRDSFSFVSDARDMMQFANFISGQNQAQQGQFVKGNKTQTEFENIMGNSSGRQQMMAWHIEARVMTPMKEILKLNILQYSTPGQIYSASSKALLEVDPVKLREAAIHYKVSDGLIPADKLVSKDTILAAFQVIAQSPQLQMEYQLGPLFTYLMAIGNLDLTPFQRVAQQQPGTPQQPVPPSPGQQFAAAQALPPPAAVQ